MNLSTIGLYTLIFAGALWIVIGLAVLRISWIELNWKRYLKQKELDEAYKDGWKMCSAYHDKKKKVLETQVLADDIEFPEDVLDGYRVYNKEFVVIQSSEYEKGEENT